jgi:RNA polymerase sigma-70 factor (ECF subfamily)
MSSIRIKHVTFTAPGGHNENVGRANHARVRQDVHLARRCVSGDRHAQRELFLRERRRVHAVLFRVLGSNADIEDLLQEAFVEIFRSMAGFRGEASLGTWLDRITVRVAFAYLARRRVETVHLSLVPDPPSSDPRADERAMTRQATARLYRVLDRIPVAQRVAFTLHVIDGRPVKAVASAMDASVVATKVRVWRAWGAIRRAASNDPLVAELIGMGRHGRKGE